MDYFKLKCKTCNELFEAILATSQDDLLAPDWEVCAEQVGTRNTERFQDFYSKHRGHSLDAVVV